MQRKNAVRTVRIRVGVGQRVRGVVDGQQLDDLQVGLVAPIAQQRQVVVLANAEIVLAFERKQWHDHARSLPFGLAVLEETVVNKARFFQVIRRNHTVCSVFKIHDFVRVGFEDNVFVFNVFGCVKREF